jgi:poly-gamma-glutamate capsule biosynthesis protein CapA/YwtB (metallophosphatase superfamily)
MDEITIAAVGDILINGKISLSAKIPGTRKYNFNKIFEAVTPYLKEADLTIGNLETPISGDQPFIKMKNSRTGFPLFNCPEDLSPALKKAGFDVLTTANNHCLDNGNIGLFRTLQVLDEQEIAHTGTFASKVDSEQFLIQEVNGIQVGILSYTKHTNRIPIHKDIPWSVNLIEEEKINSHIEHLKEQADLIIVCLHFGQEYRSIPNKEQYKLVENLLHRGADIILGTHPHVLQPILKTQDHKIAAYSLGNFVSIRLKYNPYVSNGMVLLLTVRKEDSKTMVTDVNHISTWVQRIYQGRFMKYRIIPNIEMVNVHSRSSPISTKEKRLMMKMRKYSKGLFFL